MRHALQIYRIFVLIYLKAQFRQPQAAFIRITQQIIMQESFNYTTIVAPVAFFISGIFLVLLLNRFIGKNSGQKNAG